MAEVVGPNGFSVSGNGVLAFRRARALNDGQLFWYDRDGKRLPAGGERGYAYARLSPDEKRASFSRRDLLKSGGALIVSFAFGADLPAQGPAQAAPPATPNRSPDSEVYSGSAIARALESALERPFTPSTVGREVTEPDGGVAQVAGLQTRQQPPGTAMTEPGPAASETQRTG